jgi:hypothetical protein
LPGRQLESVHKKAIAVQQSYVADDQIFSIATEHAGSDARQRNPDSGEHEA